jgi:O-antigen/teichoic acid export membrane protein
MSLSDIVRSRLALYAGINGISALATFLTVPVLVRLLGLDGFGLWSLLEPVIFFGTALALLGAEHGAMKHIAFEGQNPPGVLGAIVVAGSGTMVATGLVVYVAALTIVERSDAIVVACLAMSEGMLMLFMSASRAALRAVPFAVGQIGRTLAFYIILLGLFYAAGSGMWDISDVLRLRLWLSLALLVAVAVAMRPRPALSLERYLDAVRYGIFILVTSLLTMILDMVDRYFVSWHHGSGAVGIYMVHVKLASVVGQGIVVPFSLWFAPERLRRMDAPDGGAAFFDRTALTLTAICCLFGGATYLAGRYLVALLAPESPFDGTTLAAILIAASATGLTYALNIGLLKPGHTHLNVYSILAGLSIAIPLSALLIGPMGPHGAALARLAGTLAFLVAVAWMSQRIHRIAFSYPIMVLMALATMGASGLIAQTLPGGTLPEVILRLAVFTGVFGVIVGASRLVAFFSGGWGWRRGWNSRDSADTN